MWNDLTMSERADVIKMAVKAGLRDMNSIRKFYDNSLKYADGGPKATLVDNDKVRMSPSGTFSDDNGNIIGDSVVLPDITIKGKRKKTYNVSTGGQNYKSAFDPNGAGEFTTAILNSPLQLADYGYNRFIDVSKGEHNTDYRNGTPVQNTLGFIGQGLSPSKWIGSAKTGFKESPWSENNPGVTGNPYLDMIGDAFAVPIMTKGVKWGKGVGYNIKNRNKHAYVTIDPVGYDNPVSRFKNYAKSILSGEDVDIDAINPLNRGAAEGYVLNSFKHNGTLDGINKLKALTQISRDEAWRRYLGLPSRTDIYLSNGDGTYRYNIPKISELAGGEFIPHPANKIVDGVSVDVVDEVTGAGGGLTKSEFYETQAPYKNAQGTYDIIGKHIIEDDWDLHPFSRERDQVINKLQSLVNETADKTYKKLYDKLYSFDRPYRKITYNYLGGSALNKLRNSNGIINNKLLQKLNKKLANFEVGPVLGGKPFKMHTEIPYTKKIKPVLPDADGLYSRTPFEYLYDYEGNVPKGILDTSMFEPIGRAALSNKKAEGGSIHIVPSKRGTFTAAATKHNMGVQEFASKVLANKDSYSPAMVKKANFAKNASKWNHGLGGYLFI